MRGEVLALSDGSDPVAFVFENTIRYDNCVLTLVLHDADDDFSDCVREYASGIFSLGADPDAMTFHTAPLIRQEEQFSAMSRNMRGKIFYRMLTLVRKINVRYASLCLDTAFVTNASQIQSGFRKQLHDFLCSAHDALDVLDVVNLHYDAGQKVVTGILEMLVTECPCRVEVVPGVRQKDHLLLQVADFLCTISLIERRIGDGLPLNNAEKRFFGSPRDFKRNILRKLKSKEL